MSLAEAVVNGAAVIDGEAVLLIILHAAIGGTVGHVACCIVGEAFSMKHRTTQGLFGTGCHAGELIISIAQLPVFGKM